jgi:OOP family OmpA-OmpF porin
MCRGRSTDVNQYFVWLEVVGRYHGMQGGFLVRALLLFTALVATASARAETSEAQDGNRIYDAVVGLTRGRLIRVRVATAEARGEPADGLASFVVDGGAAPLLVSYDLRRDQIVAVALLGDDARVVVEPTAIAHPQPVELPVAHSFLLKPVHFTYGEAALSVEAVSQLDQAGLPKIVEARGAHYVVRGHSDRLESAQYKQRLSEQRAEAVRDYLVAKGAAPEDIRLVSFGALMAMTACAQRDTAVLIKCLAPDRRVTVEVIPSP